MNTPRQIPFLKPGIALGARRHTGFAEAWNWLIHSFWHMTLGDGLRWIEKWGGYPKINLEIYAGAGIDVTYSKGKVIISTGSGITTGGKVTPGGGSENPDNSGYDGIDEHPDGTITGGGGGGSGGNGGIGGGEDESGGGGGGGGSSIPGPFEPDYTNGVISGCSNCIFCAERQFVDCGTMQITASANSTGYVVLTLTHPYNANTTFSTGSASLSVESSLPMNANDAETKIPLFHITNGVVDVDLRAVPTGVLAR